MSQGRWTTAVNTLASIWWSATRPHLRHSFRVFSHLTYRERTALHDLAAANQDGDIVEIGSYLGASALAFASALKRRNRSERVYCVDTWGNDAMTEGAQDTMAKFTSNTKRFSPWIFPVRGLSTEVASTIARHTGAVSLLFIDGDHSYDACLADWRTYVPLLANHAVVVFHDVGWAEGVQRVVSEEVRPLVREEARLPNMWWGRVAR